MKLDSLDKLNNIFLSFVNKYKSLGLITHTNPDGDGLGCCLALQELIAHSKLNNNFEVGNSNKADIILEEKTPRNFHFLDAESRCISYNDKLKYPLIIMLDCHSPDRVGKCAALLEKANEILIIDHHQSDGNSDYNYKVYIYNNPAFASVGAILYQSLRKEFKALSRDNATYCSTCLYVTLLNDTANFTNSNTDSLTLSIASDLVNLGTNPHDSVKSFSQSHSPAYYRFLGLTLATITTHYDDTILFMHSTLKMLKDNNLTLESTTKITDKVKGVSDSVKIIVYFKEVEKNKYRLSLRSNHINVNAIAKIYGGGGHLKASGCEMTGSLKQIQKKILEQIIQQLIPKKEDLISEQFV